MRHASSRAVTHAGHAHALSVRAVPTREHAVRAYSTAVLPTRRDDARSREVLAVLSGIRLPVPMAEASVRAMAY